jgi:hypothetical protein
MGKRYGDNLGRGILATDYTDWGGEFGEPSVLGYRAAPPLFGAEVLKCGFFFGCYEVD